MLVKHTCCLCGKEFVGWGNNPWPLSEKEEDRCCDTCNANKVIPARLTMLYRREEENK